MRVFAGTSGYSYKEWKGSFYPEKLPAAEMLRYYAGRLDTVEINNTFYRMPTEKVVLQWAEQTPEGFRFVLKASRRITHLKRLAGVEDELEYFLRTSSALGEKRGPTLFQLPPGFRKDLGRLARFLDLLPRGWPAAVEFRHPSWFEDDVTDLLRERNVALVMAETEEATPPVMSTADWGYLRLRREDYTGGDLRAWADRIRGQGWNAAYVFFKHEDEAHAPRYAEEFRGLLAG